MKVTVDTNFIVSATQWDYSVAHKLLKKFILSDVQIFTSEDILNETADVLIRDFKYSKDDTKKIIEILLFFMNKTISNQKIEIIKDDPDDNKILECAIASSSDYIITYDKHLLKVNGYKGIKIIKPEEIIKEF